MGLGLRVFGFLRGFRAQRLQGLGLRVVSIGFFGGQGRLRSQAWLFFRVVFEIWALSGRVLLLMI